MKRFGYLCVLVWIMGGQGVIPSLAKEPEVPEVVPQSGDWAGYRVSK